jgi:type I restriction enzyme R subunit
LRTSVKRRYAETLDFSEYEPKIQKLLDMHVGTEAAEQITPLVNIFDKDAFAAEVEKLVSVSAKADTIAHRTSRTIYEHMGEDPVFYQKFSDMLQKVIDDFRAKRISENEYLTKAIDVMNSVVNRTGDDIPDVLDGHEVAKAYYGIAQHYLSESIPNDKLNAGNYAEIALAMDEIIDRNRIVQWADNEDVKNRMSLEIEDWLFDFAAKNKVELDFEVLDSILKKCINVAIIRKAEVNL